MDEFDFRDLPHADLPTLIIELADVHTLLANLHSTIAFARSTHIRAGDKGAQPDVIELEAERDSLIEKKFLLARLIDLHGDRGDNG